MPQSVQLIETLKSALKAQRKTYRDVAAALQLSEASVKRLFSEKNLSLKRLEQICRMLDLEISDLVQQMNADTQKLTRLTEQQEQEIADDLQLLLVTVCVLNRWTLPDMLQHYQLSEPQCIQYLARLDRLGIIELFPGNRIKLRIAPNFAWRTNGPIQRFFQERIHLDFFQSRFDQEDEALLVVNGMLSKNNNAVFQGKLQKLAREFDELNNTDAALDLEDRNGTTVVLAMRPWGYGVFAKLRR